MFTETEIILAHNLMSILYLASLSNHSIKSLTANT